MRFVLEVRDATSGELIAEEEFSSYEEATEYRDWYEGELFEQAEASDWPESEEWPIITLFWHGSTQDGLV